MRDSGDHRPGDGRGVCMWITIYICRRVWRESGAWRESRDGVGATGERVVCGYSMSRNILETDLRVNRLGDMREGLFLGPISRAQRGPRLVGVPEATMGPELHRRAYS